MPGNWPQWHPSSLRVWGITERTLQIGESCHEEQVVAGRRGSCEWVARECVPGRRWAIEAQTPGGSTIVLYMLDPLGDFTRYERVFRYRMPNVFPALLDILVLRRRLRRESEEATLRLKARLEG